MAPLVSPSLNPMSASTTTPSPFPIFAFVLAVKVLECDDDRSCNLMIRQIAASHHHSSSEFCEDIFQIQP